MLIKEVPFGTTVPGKKNAAFIVITCQCKVYKNYTGGGKGPDKDQLVDLVLMFKRWDGNKGFPGGMVEGNETLVEAVQREAIEEINYDLFDDEPLENLSSHELDKIVVHAFHYNMGIVEIEPLQKITRDFMLAEHLVAEGMPVWIHLKDYGRNKGLPSVLSCNSYSSAVKEELEILCKKLDLI